MLPVPTFVLALTNRRELIIGVLRPGRWRSRWKWASRTRWARRNPSYPRGEDASGRLSLDRPGAADAAPGDGCVLEQVDDETYDAWIEEMAEATGGFSGALAAVVRRPSHALWTAPSA